MPVATDDERIRGGLTFLAQADEAMINASRPLMAITGGANLPGTVTLLDRFTFTIAGADYSGQMTREQADYLRGNVGSLRRFADAVASLLVVSDERAIEALRGLRISLGSPVTPSPQVVDPPVHCCTYNSGSTKNTTRSYCESGLKGHWDPLHDCKHFVVNSDDDEDDDDVNAEAAEMGG